MAHFVYTKEAAADSMGLTSTKQISYYINQCLNKGIDPSKRIGGVEYFDVDMLLNVSMAKVRKRIKYTPQQLLFNF